MTSELIPRTRLVLAPGAVHIPYWLSIDEQRHLVASCREWAKPPAPIRAARMPNGGVMSVKTVCLGWQWIPYRYSRFAEDTDGAPVDPFPDWLVELGRRAVVDAFDDRDAAAAYAPDAALVNYYDANARLGLHQDQDEHAGAPVVSLSLGDSGIFRFGNPHTRGRPYTDLEVRSGDVVVFGGPSRYAYHGVPRILPGSGNPDVGLTDGRWNITLRVTGMSG
ncbi:MAG TPA: alpha-ketoglutarate-dependent dioxygenase AlkB [Acidimicrobiales bacterium]|nr:alpha-ketoglutarate-dependent dioxygenase AlkB [Acidimicrobiales bacterium]